MSKFGIPVSLSTVACYLHNAFFYYVLWGEYLYGVLPADFCTSYFKKAEFQSFT